MGKKRKKREMKYMSKLLRITPEVREEITREMNEKLNSTQYLNGGLFSFTKAFSRTERATITFTQEAWSKMTMLVQNFSTEVAWHGLTRRGEAPNEYVIYDILVYPQEVTGANVVTDEKLYPDWVNALDDEPFNDLRMQGHSHVNMGVSPSTTDIENQQKIINQLEGEMFYIFMIWNKRYEKYIKILDLKSNLLFETADVDLKTDGNFLEFLAEAQKMVVQKSYAYNFPAKQTKGAGVITTPVTAKDNAGKKGKKTEETKEPKQHKLPADAFDDDGDYYGGYYGRGYYGSY